MKTQTIKKRNNRFERMTVAQKRVAICKDAIRQINTGRFHVYKGNWCDLPVQDSRTINKKLLTSAKRPVCQVCALGAVLASSIRLFNKAEIDEGTATFGEMECQLGPMFTHQQMALIEAVFEQRSIPLEGFNARIKSSILVECQDRYSPMPSTRAVQILKNIIKNNGTFKP